MNLPLGDFVNGGAATGLLAVVLMVINGRLVPRKHIDEILKEAHYTTELWKSAYENSEARGDVLTDQVKELTEQGRTVQHFIQSLREASHIGTTHVDS